MGIEVGSFTDVGLKRQVNQDSILVFQKKSSDFSLFVVADGMGGYADGEKASSTITTQLRDWLDTALEAGNLGSPTAIFTGLGEKLSEINLYIHEELNRNQICGSTCALLFFHEDMYGLFSVGDSRIYRVRALRFELLTQDDVWENIPSVREQFSPAERRRNPNFGKLTHAVGSQPALSYSMNTGRLAEGDVFALCSDGVYKMCPEAFLKRAVRGARRRDLNEVCEDVKREVYRCGAQDNLSLILVRWSQK